jgi:hypothetical protein
MIICWLRFSPDNRFGRNLAEETLPAGKMEQPFFQPVQSTALYY